jgi:hypothetical protein
MAATYKIRKTHVGNGPNGRKYPQYTISLPIEIAEPLHAAGFRVRFEVREDCIAIIPVPSDRDPHDTAVRDKAASLVDRFTNGKGV